MWFRKFGAPQRARTAGAAFTHHDTGALMRLRSQVRAHPISCVARGSLAALCGVESPTPMRRGGCEGAGMTMRTLPSLRSPMAIIALCLAALFAAGAGCNTPTAPCPGAKGCPLAQPCLATHENASAQRFGLRIAEIVVRSPTALGVATGAGRLFQSSVTPSRNECNFGDHGDGLTAWLLRFDLTQLTLTLGGAAGVPAPTTGFTFFDAMVTQGGTSYHVAPVTLPLTENADGSFGTATPADVDLPVFFVDPTTPTVLPLHSLSIAGTVSASHDCIGSYDPANFDPTHSCRPTTPNEFFRHGGHLQAYLSLEQADTIDVGGANETLCAELAGVPGAFNRSPIARCSRTNGVIDFKGDWCAATNGPATSTCADAVHATADFAASAEAIQD
jgi:hypothetical protein